MAAITRPYDYTADRDSGSPNNVISADKLDLDLDTAYTAINNKLDKDGTVTATANQPLGGFKLTGHSVAAPTARSDSVSAANLQDNQATFIAAAGTDTITATYAPAITALVNGMELCFQAAAANTSTTPTFSPNGLTAKTIVKGHDLALTVGDISGQHHECRVRYNSTTDHWHLLNPRTTLTDSQNLLVGGNGTMNVAVQRNAQTGTTYTIISTDRGRHITFSNASAVAVTCPIASATPFNLSGYVIVENIGAGLVTITPTTSTINGAATLLLQTGEAYLITSDGTNYRALAMGHSTVAETDFVAGSDTLDMLDASTGSRKSVTGQILFNSVADVATDASPATGDFVLANDVSASNVAVKQTHGSIQTLFVASQAQMETGTSNAVNVTPGRLPFHQAACKGWVRFTIAASDTASFNVNSITDTSAAKWAVVWEDDFSSANYCVVTGSEAVANNETAVDTLSAGGVNVKMYRSDDTNTAETNSTASHVAAFGDR